jgi:hypothetical protein
VVRDRKFEIIDEVCRRYDIDGVEMDFIRHPVLFKSIFQGHRISEEQIAAMTSLIRRIRQRMDQIGEGRGRPLLLAARVPDSLELSLAIGLDLETWMREGLLDILIAGGGYSPFGVPVQEVVTPARAYGVPVYPCINSGIGEGNFLQATRALATKWYSQGADGVYFWNLGSPFVPLYGDEQAWREACRKWYSCLSEVGDPKVMERRAKEYRAVEPVWFPYAFLSGEADLPLELTAGRVGRIPLVIGDDVPGLIDRGVSLECRLEMEIEGSVPDTPPRLQLNGTRLEDPKFKIEESRATVTYSGVEAQVRQGRNLVEILPDDKERSSEDSLRVVWLLLRVTFGG